MLRTLDRREYLMWKAYRNLRRKWANEAGAEGKQLLEW
jgi:hypothetical protein